MVKFRDLKANDEIQLDGGFSCTEPGVVRIHDDGDGQLYFYCEKGMHYLDIHNGYDLIGVIRKL